MSSQEFTDVVALRKQCAQILQLATATLSGVIERRDAVLIGVRQEEQRLAVLSAERRLAEESLSTTQDEGTRLRREMAAERRVAEESLSTTQDETARLRHEMSAERRVAEESLSTIQDEVARLTRKLELLDAELSPATAADVPTPPPATPPEESPSSVDDEMGRLTKEIERLRADPSPPSSTDVTPVVTPNPTAVVTAAPLTVLYELADVLVTSAVAAPPEPPAQVAHLIAPTAPPVPGAPSATGSASSGLAARLSRVLPHAGGYRYVATGLLSVLLLGLAVLLTPVSQLAGWQIFAVQSGSMEPTINVGGIVFVHPVPADQLKVRDVITFVDQNRPDTFVTHRIVELTISDGQAQAKTKGDANDTADAWSVPMNKTVGRVDLALPFLGYLMAWLSSPLAKVTILGIAVLGLAVPSVQRRSGVASVAVPALALEPIRPAPVAVQAPQASAPPVGAAQVSAPLVSTQALATSTAEPSFEDIEREILQMLGTQDPPEQLRAA